MANDAKNHFLIELKRRLGRLKKLPESQSLYEVGDGAARIYVRYSKIHEKNKTFYGLRKKDLQQLEGYTSAICFLWPNQPEPLLVPFADYEEIFRTTSPAEDGQFKAMVFVQPEGCEFYIANVGRFNVEAYLGWEELENRIDSGRLTAVTNLTHSQIQTMIGSIGDRKGYDIWIPANDRSKMDWSVTTQFRFHGVLPPSFETVKDVIEEIDVIWLQRGSGEPKGLFEIEHSTPIYSGLLRFNDIHLIAPGLRPRFSIVANETRRSVFVRLLNRPTFRTSGLSELCTFLEYANLVAWHNRVHGKTN